MEVKMINRILEALETEFGRDIIIREDFAGYYFIDIEAHPDNVRYIMDIIEDEGGYVEDWEVDESAYPAILSFYVST